ncbi:MAG: four helix bundle protein [Deltaproteobacteria bacterium]|nr:four helix bundle protein [Deltaproteobacteria bacterium]
MQWLPKLGRGGDTRRRLLTKMNEALGKAMETQAWSDHARDCSYMNGKQHRELDDAWQHVGAMLNRMIERADDFCKAARR